MTLMSNETISEKKTHRALGVANYYVSIAVDIVLLYVLNNLQYFGISIITKDYISCLWAINLALSFGIIGNFILLLYRPRWFHHLVRSILDALALFAVYVVFKIFPLSFDTDVLPTSVRIILILIMAGIFIGFIVELIRLAVALSRRRPTSQTPVPPLTPVTPEPSTPGEQPSPPGTSGPPTA
jgi:hypothetical protein